jgi:electron transfer flavoprotein beta subunit
MLAEMLGLPHSTLIMEVRLEDGRVRARREMESGWFEWLELPLPALLTIQSGINQVRYATLKGIMGAKKKEIRRVEPALADGSPTVVEALAFPSRDSGAEIFEGDARGAAAKLWERLRRDGKVR